MTSSLAVAGVPVMRSLRLGSLRLTPYGACAAVGLIAGMSLARRSARRSELDPEAVWDAGLFAIISCFFASRLLLVLRDPIAFTRYPLLVLGLPSLTLGGMALAAVMLWAYLRRKRLALLSLLDVFAAPGAVLAAALELGHALDGSEVGMPTTLPWAVRDPWNPGPLRVHPVALYGVAASLLLAIVLWRTPSQRPAGRIAALGLLLGGAASFLLDMLTQPLLTPVNLWIEPGQWLAMGAMLAGAVLWTLTPMRAETSATEASAPTLYIEPLHTETR